MLSTLYGDKICNVNDFKKRICQQKNQKKVWAFHLNPQLQKYSVLLKIDILSRVV